MKTIENMAHTLSPVQVEACWEFVPSSEILMALGRAGNSIEAAKNVTADDCRRLVEVITKQFCDDQKECLKQLKQAFFLGTDVLRSCIKFRVGNYAEYDFIKRYVPEHMLQQLVWEAITRRMQEEV